MKAVAGFVGTLTDAWDEIRVHKTRLFLSLLGVFLAVAALTTVAGMGALLEKTMGAVGNQMGGAPVSFDVTASGGPSAEETADRFDEQMAAVAERYGITYMSRQTTGEVSAQFPDGVGAVQVTAVDVPFGDMRSVPISEGAWFADDDALRLAPAVVVDDLMWQQLGSPALSEHPTVELTAPRATTAVIVGVYESGMSGVEVPGMGSQATAYMLADAYDELSRGEDAGAGDNAGSLGPMGVMGGGGGTRYSVWLPEETGDDLGWRIKTDLQSALGPDVTVNAERTDAEGRGYSGMGGLTVTVTAVSSIVLVIGVVGYINLAILSVDNRVREIGIRRSFGATGGRIFVAVLLESVVGTVIAGLAGVALAVPILSNPAIQAGITGGMPGVSAAFPVEAAWTGLGVSVFVGILSGIIPAIIATRIKVIDALRL